MSSSSPTWSSSAAPTWPASTGRGPGSSRPTPRGSAGPDEAPYDRVLVSRRAAHPARRAGRASWVDDGRMVIPVDGTMLLVRRTAVGRRRSAARLATGSCRCADDLERRSLDLTPCRTPELGEELVRLASADNFRDVTGPDSAYVAARRPARCAAAWSTAPTSSSSPTPTRRRSPGSASPRSTTCARTHEVEAHPDAEVPGATWHHLEVAGIPMDAGRPTSRRARPPTR